MEAKVDIEKKELGLCLIFEFKEPVSFIVFTFLWIFKTINVIYIKCRSWIVRQYVHITIMTFSALKHHIIYKLKIFCISFS